MITYFDHYDSDAQDRFTNSQDADCVAVLGGSRNDPTDIIFTATGVCASLAGTYKLIDKTATGVNRKWKHTEQQLYLWMNDPWQMSDYYACIWDTLTPEYQYYYYSKACLYTGSSVQPVNNGNYWYWDPYNTWQQDSTAVTKYWSK